MTVRNSLFVVMMVLAATASPATAATITYALREGASGPGSFELTAQVSEDTFGLAQYAVALSGYATLDHTNVSPVGVNLENFQQFGFNFARSANTSPVVSAAQDVTNASPILVYNIGKTAGSLSAAVPSFGGGKPDATGSYGVPVVLAKGTYAQSAPPVIGQVDGLAFTNMQGAFAVPDGGFIVRQLPSGIIPEPATVALGGLAMVGLLGMRRRSA